MSNAWHWKYNPVKILFIAFFCTTKNGDKVTKQFSAKKFWAFCLTLLAVANHAHLHIAPTSHWTVELTKHAVDNSVQIALIASLDALSASALAIYGWAKSKGAA